MAIAQSQAQLILYYRYSIAVDPALELATYCYKKAVKQGYTAD